MPTGRIRSTKRPQFPPRPPQPAPPQAPCHHGDGEELKDAPLRQLPHASDHPGQVKAEASPSPHLHFFRNGGAHAPIAGDATLNKTRITPLFLPLQPHARWNIHGLRQAHEPGPRRLRRVPQDQGEERYVQMGATGGRGNAKAAPARSRHPKARMRSSLNPSFSPTRGDHSGGQDGGARGEAGAGAGAGARGDCGVAVGGGPAAAGPRRQGRPGRAGHRPGGGPGHPRGAPGRGPRGPRGPRARRGGAVAGPHGTRHAAGLCRAPHGPRRAAPWHASWRHAPPRVRLALAAAAAAVAAVFCQSCSPPSPTCQ